MASYRQKEETLFSPVSLLYKKFKMIYRNNTDGNDPRWPIANISGLQLSVEVQRTRGHHTFRQILVAHGAEDPQWRSHTGRQRDSCGRRSGFASTSAWQRSEQSKQGWLPLRPRFAGPTPVPSTTPEAVAAAVTVPQRGSSRHRVNETGSPSEVWSPGKAESPITDTRRKPDRRILGRKAPSVLTRLLWPWELTTWTSTQET
uniref:uncharacterized protein LOC128928471 isoform X1 n=2 Tax=Callithrix jacchus TaxID=9483 RepID=UPI0023DD46F9|nr:uncharacterized protein LOC128928471 isoform X1 [Callithrix jacchus]